MEYDRSFLNETFNHFGITLTTRQADRFCAYFELLSYWNNIHNLTTVIDWKSVVKLHFLDSVLPIELCSGAVLDVGAGAGFPSLPLAIMSDGEFVAIDSVSKKVDFMNLVARELQLDNFSALHSRAEDYVKTRNDFDRVVSRGVAPLNILSEYCIPFLKLGGAFLAYKSKNVNDEVVAARRAITLLGGAEPKIYSFDHSDLSRSVLYIEKVSATPSGYPRGGNKPRLKPL